MGMDRIEKATEESPLARGILNGEVKVSRAESSNQSREVWGRNWHGTAHHYEIVVPPNLAPGGKEWATEVTLWIPNKSREQYVDTPPMQIFILTGHGEMTLGEKNKAVKDKLFQHLINIQ